MRCLRACVLAVLVSACAGVPSASALGISVPAMSVGNLKPGTTSTSSPGTIVVSGLALEAWSLRVDDPAGQSTDGHMLRSGACTLGVASLASPLHMAFSGGLGTTTFDRPSYDLDSASNPVVAHGSTPDSFSLTLSQAVGAGETLRSGCSYSLTIRYTVAAG